MFERVCNLNIRLNYLTSNKRATFCVTPPTSQEHPQSSNLHHKRRSTFAAFFLLVCRTGGARTMVVIVQTHTIANAPAPRRPLFRCCKTWPLLLKQIRRRNCYNSKHLKSGDYEIWRIRKSFAQFTISLSGQRIFIDLHFCSMQSIFAQTFANIC